MANVEKYIFGVDADTSKAVSKLQQINKLMDQIDGVRNRGMGEYFTTTQKDMDKSMRSMSQLTKLYRSLDRELSEIQRKMEDVSGRLTIPKGATKEQEREIKRLKQQMAEQSQAAISQQRALQSEYNKTLRKFRELSTFQQNSSKNFKHVFSSNDLFNLPTGAQNFNRAKSFMQAMASEADGVSSKIDEVKAKIQSVNKLDRRAESLTRRAEASKYMSYQQASNYRRDYRTVTQEYGAERESNANAMARLGQERTTLHNRVQEIQTKANATQQDIDKKIGMQQTIDAIDKEIQARMELDRVLNRTTQNMKDYEHRVTKDGGVEVKPERGTVAGMMYERAPAIGLALTGAAAGVAGGLYHQGAQLNRGIRSDVVSIGQRTDSDNWTETIRNNALDSGLQDRLGFGGQEMLAFQNNYLSNAGYKGMDDLNSAMTSQAIFSRTTGVDSDATRDFFDTAFSTGAVNGSQVKDIQNAFIGAIKQSGMEGREKDQLKALQGLLDGVSRGRSMTNDEVMNVMGMQSVLASTGVRSLSGEKGGQLLSDLNEGIRQSIDNPTARLIFGQGTKYQGLEGRFALRKQLEKGISDVDNVKSIAAYAQSQADTEGGQNEVFAQAVRSLLGTDITSEQTEGLMGLYRDGKLTDETLKGYVDSNESTGSKTADERLSKYQDSKEATSNQSEATTEKQATELYDYGNVLREANAAMSGLNPLIYTATAALGGLAVAATGAAGSFLMSSVLRRTVAGRMGSGGATLGGLGRRGGGGTTGGGGGGFFGALRSSVGRYTDPYARAGGLPNTGPAGGAASSSGGLWSRITGGARATAAGAGTAAAGAEAAAGAGAGASAAGAASGGSKVLSTLGKVGGALSKVALPLSIIASVGSIAAAPEDKKGEATGSAAGGIGGGLAGAAAGAAIGSVVPVVGTAIGGLIGGLAGSFGGSSLGGWVGSMFDPKTAEAAELPETEKAKGADEKIVNDLDKQVDKETTNTKDRAENKKADNLALEKANIKRYEALLDQADQLLNKARLQNGIMGSLGGADASGSGGAGVGGSTGKLKILSGNQKWANPNDLKNSDLGYTDGKLTAEDLDKWIESKAPEGSMMRGMGSAFLKAGQESGLDPRYLVAHAAQETGWGTSNILKDKNNWFGIGAFDNSPHASAKTFGGKQQGIIDGAKWIAQNYYSKGNTTLDKMKKAGYATDPQWTNNISNIMKNAPTGTGSVKVESTINVNVKGGDDVAKKVTSNAQMKSLANQVNNAIYGSMNYYSKEVKRV
ncbi:endo-beta-N-acetylglucosamidase [Bacillus phage BSP10]|nr:endo-beta-N-acetylglucosamidase [Bacillus phage BSP10]QRI44795.1 tail lysin [Bacillus phage BSTP3]